MLNIHRVVDALHAHRLSMRVDYIDGLVTIALRPSSDSDLLCPIEGRGIDIEDAAASVLWALDRRIAFTKGARP